eukprot:GHVS01105527.1.p1 GENE.GHVS01105527.1~~GHVS01105527.1.p1  ORF type:complete len:123 (+),score=6.30 GHVS01105527.1:408-776(+)
MASSRRLDRLVFGGRWATLSRIQRIGVFLKQSDNHIANDFVEWFVPVLRYHNPQLQIDIRHAPEASTERLLLTTSTSTTGRATTGNDPTEITKELSIDAHKSSHHLMHELLKLDKHLTSTTA